MTRPLAAAFLVLLFIAGVAAGVFVDRLFLLEPRGPGPVREGPPPPGAPPPAMFMSVLERELSLTPAQREQINAIVQEAQGEARAAFERARPEIEAARKRTSERIAAVLTPEQRARFEALERERPPGGPPPGGPPPGGPPPGGPPPGGPPPHFGGPPPHFGGPPPGPPPR